MLIYFAKMALLLPLLGLLIWGSLKLTKKMQDQLSGKTGSQRSIKLVETCFLGPGMRVAVIEFRGREILLGSSKNGLTRLSEAPISPESISPEPISPAPISSDSILPNPASPASAEEYSQ